MFNAFNAVVWCVSKDAWYEWERRMPILLSGEGAARSSGNSRIVTRTIVATQTSVWAAITVRPRYYQAEACTYFCTCTQAHAYWTVITSRVTVARSGVGYATPRPEGSRLGASQDREIGKMCKRVCVRERCRRDERGDSMEQTRETVKGGSRPREREKPPENYKLYVVPNRPSKIIPAHPAAIMNM